MGTTYTELSDVSDLQRKIMQFIDLWVHEKKTIVPFKEIVGEMKKQNVGYDSSQRAIYSLLKKGYIRRSQKISNQVFFVQLRRV